MKLYGCERTEYKLMVKLSKNLVQWAVGVQTNGLQVLF